MTPGVRLFVGSQGATIRGERVDLDGDRCFTPVHRLDAVADPSRVTVLLDSGAFTDSPRARLTPDAALDRQLRWEAKASETWGASWQSYALVSYDLLIDETWTTDDIRVKRRWSVRDADRAVRETIDAAAYLASRRADLAPRVPVLACQGVDPLQYAECAAEILRYAQPGDWLGLGGWCILGRYTRLLPIFWTTLYSVLPLVAYAGVRHIHIFGVMWQRALGGLLWIADRHGLTVSTDSSAPILACTRANTKKAGCRHPYWRENVRILTDELANLRSSRWYAEPPRIQAVRQLELVEAS